MSASTDGPFVVIADLMSHIVLKDIDGRDLYAPALTPRRLTKALLEMEWARHGTEAKPHPGTDIRAAFAMLVPQGQR